MGGAMARPRRVPGHWNVMGHISHVNYNRGAPSVALQWRHNGRYSFSNHQPHDCLLNCLFRRRSKKTSKLRVTGLFAGNSPVTGEFPAQMVSYAENVSIWWRHHEWTIASATCRLQAQVLNEWLYEHLLSNPLYIIFKTAINICWVKSNCNVLTNSRLTFHSTTSQFTKERKHDCFAIPALCAANPRPWCMRCKTLN